MAIQSYNNATTTSATTTTDAAGWDVSARDVEGVGVAG
jgi:hypothetical protein